MTPFLAMVHLRVNKTFYKFKIKYIGIFYIDANLYGAIFCIEASYPELCI